MADNNSGSIEIMGGKLSDKITALKLIATDFERRITGYKQGQDGLTWDYTGDVLVGSSTASRLTGFLQSFCNEINLISENDYVDLAWEKFKNMDAILSSCLLDIYCEEHYNTIIVLFDNALTRILRVIGSSKEMFKDYFNRSEDEKKGEDPPY